MKIKVFTFRTYFCAKGGTVMYHTSKRDRGARIYIPVISTGAGEENYSFPHSAGRNEKYIGFPVHLTKTRMLYLTLKLGKEQLFVASTYGILHYARTNLQ